jgi:lipase chaperone LimK
MKRRVLYIVLVSALTVSSITYFLVNSSSKDQEYIFDRHDNISISDVKESLKFSTPSKVLANTKRSSQKTNIKFDHQALKYFKSLEKLYPESKDIDEHLKMVKSYLLSRFPLDEATTLFETYRSYLTCEVDISKKIDITDINSSDPMEVIEALARIQNIRREKMGDELADALFGAKVKSSEYSIRKAAILEDNSLYGSEKEDALNILNSDMWGDEADDLNKDTSSYNLYQEKLKMYKRDIGELDSDGKQNIIKNFRKEFFSAEAVNKLEVVEKRRAEEKNRESSYYEKEKLIWDSQEFNDETKKDKIEALQDDIFGNDADNFRARQNLKVK